MNEGEIKADDYEIDRTDLQIWFGLSYASFLVLPRVSMQLMPEEWQSKMAELLHQYNETIDTNAFGVRGCSVRALDENGKLMKMPEEWTNYRRPLPSTKEILLKK